MKNITIKLLGVVMTLAILAGLFMVAVPVSAATEAWSSMTQPTVTPGANSNVYAMASDEKTIYLFNNPAMTPATIAAGTGVGTTMGNLIWGTTTITVTTAGTFTITLPTGTTGTAAIVSGITALSVTSLVAGANTETVTGTGTFTIALASSALFKSVDAGKTWSSSGLDTGSALAGKIVVSMAVDTTGVDLIAATSTTVYRSTNSGVTWQSYQPSTTISTVYSVAVGLSSSDALAYLVGADNGVWLYDPDNLGGWTSTALGTATFGAGRAIAVAFSPTYASDTTVMAVSAINGTVPSSITYGTSASILLETCVTNSAPSSAVWNTDVYDSSIVAAGSTVASTNIASIAVPTSYGYTTSSNWVYVGIGDTTGSASAGGVYRVNGSQTAHKAGTELGLLGYDISSVAYVGDISSGVLAAGTYSSPAQVFTTTTPRSSSPSWNTSTNNPSAVNSTPMTKVAFLYGSTASSYTLYAGTWGYGSAMSTSTDGLSFAGIGFINVDSYADTSILGNGGLTGAGAATEFFVLKDTGPTTAYIIFKSIDTGATWTEVYNNASYALAYGSYYGTVSGVKESPSFSTDDTVYIQQGSPATKIIKSTDGGANWTAITVPGSVSIAGFAPIDGSNYWFSSAAGVRATNTSTTVSLDGNVPAMLVAISGFFIAGTTTGEVYVSTDTGATFTRLGSLAQFGSGVPRITWDVPTKTIYAVDTSGNIVKWTVGTDSTWTVAVATADLISSSTTAATDLTNADITGISESAGGVWYIQSSGTYKIYTSNDLVGADFQVVPSSSFTYNIISKPFPAVTVDSSGNQTIYVATMTAATTTTYVGQWVMFTNAVLAAPTTVAPAASAVISATVDFSWNSVAYSSGTVKYELQIAYDSGFNNLVLDTNSTTSSAASTTNPLVIQGTVYKQVALTGGETYYWRVRVFTPNYSQWSTPVSFTTQLGSTGSSSAEGLDTAGRIYPVNGATDVTTTPTFTWGAVNGASGYNFKLSDKADFSTTIDSATSLTGTLYQTSQTLTAGKTYFWEVQAVNGTVTGNWVTSAFTVAAAGAAAGGSSAAAAQTVIVTPTFTIPAATVNVQVPAPTVTVNTSTSAPSWVWVIIAIGAVLVIAVIVLIARTRRV